MWDKLAHTPIFHHVTRQIFDEEIKPLNKPAILKGYINHWSLVNAAKQSPAALCNFIKPFASNRPVKAWYGAAEMGGRFFYSDDIKGRNFETKELLIGDLLDQLLASQEGNPMHLFAGAINLPEHMPALVNECPMDLLDSSMSRLTSLWIGNKTRTAAHWDLPQNLACVVAGRRRFTLFPISQVSNLYIGPIDNTLAGQPASMVDFYNPDFEKFPRFKEALNYAEVAELESGDVLYMPSMWVHHVESLEPFGAMLNFWWREAPSYMPTPLYTLIYALGTLRELPEYERAAWRSLFDYYVFNHQSADASHIPPEAQGILGPMTAEHYQNIKRFLLQTMSR